HSPIVNRRRQLTIEPLEDRTVPTVSAMGDYYSAIHDHAISAVNVLSNDTNTNQQSLTATVITGPSHAASYSLASNGDFSYTAATHYTGYDSITYEAAANGETSQATITIEMTNHAPNLMGVFLSMPHDRTNYDIDLLANA